MRSADGRKSEIWYCRGLQNYYLLSSQIRNALRLWSPTPQFSLKIVLPYIYTHTYIHIIYRYINISIYLYRYIHTHVSGSALNKWFGIVNHRATESLNGRIDRVSCSQRPRIYHGGSDSHYHTKGPTPQAQES